MVEIFGTLERSETRNGTQINVFRIPALSEAIARRRANGNARLKGLEGFQVASVEEVESGSLPGQSVYNVTVESST